ncbi:MAG: hypothetical protein B7X06_04375, partial [Verrucomicrobia bacterium 21-51-4]
MVFNRKRLLLEGIVVAIITAGLRVAAFPPWDLCWLGLFAYVPWLVWVSVRGPEVSTRVLGGVALLGAWLLWAILLAWLRHVTVVGWLVLAAILALFESLWWVVAARITSSCVNRNSFARIFNMLGLASLWVVLEYVRGHIFGGFPWLPMAAIFWQTPYMLTLLPW